MKTEKEVFEILTGVKDKILPGKGVFDVMLSKINPYVTFFEKMRYTGYTSWMMNSTLIKFGVPAVIVLIIIAGFFALKGTKKSPLPSVAPVAEQAQTIPATGKVDDAAKAMNVNADTEAKATLDEANDASSVDEDAVATSDVEGSISENDF